MVLGQPQKIKDKYLIPPKHIRETGSENDRKGFDSSHNILKKNKSSPQLVPLIMMQSNNLSKLDSVVGGPCLSK